MDNDLALKEAALKEGFVSNAEFDRIADLKKMVKPYVAGSAAHRRSVLCQVAARGFSGCSLTWSRPR
jgi:hypothetical protein